MRPQCGLRAELTEAAVEAARKSPVSRTKQERSSEWMAVSDFSAYLAVSKEKAPMHRNPFMLQCFLKNAATTAPGPAWVPTTEQSCTLRTA